MTLRRLDWALRSRGTVMADWPARERDAALVLLRHSPAARALLADALAREDAEPAGLSDGCALVRMQGALCRAVLQLPPLPFAVRWGVLAGCAAAGLYLGIAGVSRDAWADAGADAADAFAAVQSLTVASGF